MTDARVLLPDEHDGSYEAADIQRVRLAEMVERAGLSLEAIARAIASGHLTFAFVGAIWPDPVPLLPGLTIEGMASQHGVSLDFLHAARHGLGVPWADGDDPVRQDDLDMMPTLVGALTAGFSEKSLVHHARLLGDSLRRVAQSQVRLFHESIEAPMTASGMTQQQILHFGAQFGPALQATTERLVLLLYRRHLEHYVAADLIGHVEDAMEKVGLARRVGATASAVGFVECEGLSRWEDEHVGPDAPDPTRAFTQAVEGACRSHGGRLVKLVGDAIMIEFVDPAGAIACCVAGIDGARTRHLPPARAGVHAGPVATLERDLYGRTVDTAARIAAYAGPGQVLASQEFLAAAGLDPSGLEALGPVALRGLPRPVTLFRTA